MEEGEAFAGAYLSVGDVVLLELVGVLINNEERRMRSEERVREATI